MPCSTLITPLPLQTHHVDGSPLLLCDTCPRSYHMACLEVTYPDLPEGEWSCIKCSERAEKDAKRIAEFESRKSRLLEE